MLRLKLNHYRLLRRVALLQEAAVKLYVSYTRKWIRDECKMMLTAKLYGRSRSMLSEEDYAEACLRYKDRRTKLPERQRYHALILAAQGYSYREVGRILLVDEESISQWVHSLSNGWSARFAEPSELGWRARSAVSQRRTN